MSLPGSPAPGLPDLVALAGALAESAPADAAEAHTVIQSVLAGCASCSAWTWRSSASSATASGSTATWTRRRARAAAAVLEVLAVGRVQTVFQPIIDLRSGRPAGWEALSRFPSGRPDEWFARAADAGLAVPLELAALEEAVRHVPELPEGAYLAVNLSPATLVSPQFEARAADLPLRRLVIELTEQTEVSCYSALADRVRWLRERGGRVAVDDAGSGYAGLERIVTISPDILKLDAHLTRGVVDDPARQAMAAAMGWFAERIGAKLVAEGVEDADELEALRGLGVSFVQGFHTGRPRPALR